MELIILLIALWGFLYVGWSIIKWLFRTIITHAVKVGAAALDDKQRDNE